MRIFMNREGLKYAAESAASENDSELPFPSAELITVMSHPNAGARNDEEIASAIARLRAPPIADNPPAQGQLGI